MGYPYVAFRFFSTLSLVARHAAEHFVPEICLEDKRNSANSSIADMGLVFEKFNIPDITRRCRADTSDDGANAEIGIYDAIKRTIEY